MTRTSPIWVQECVVIYLRIPTEKQKNTIMKPTLNGLILIVIHILM